MGNKTLYIIGNGFDIYHGIPSWYSNFRDYLQVEDNDIFEYVQKYLPVNESWSDFEDSMSGIDVDGLVDDASQYLESYGADDWSDAFHHNYQYEINRIVEGLSEGIKDRFSDWIQSLKIPTRAQVSEKLLDLDDTGIYLNFNYTNTLEKVYGVEEERILYIHGNSVDGEDLVLGHAWNPYEIPSLNDVPNPEDMDTRIMEGNEIINEYFGSTFKPTTKIIEEYQSYFEGLSDITDIKVLGHSMSDVDFEYLIKILNSIKVEKVNWFVSYHGDLDLENKQNAMCRLGVPPCKVKYQTIDEI